MTIPFDIFGCREDYDERQVQGTDCEFCEGLGPECCPSMMNGATYYQQTTHVPAIILCPTCHAELPTRAEAERDAEAVVGPLAPLALDGDP